MKFNSIFAALLVCSLGVAQASGVKPKQSATSPVVPNTASTVVAQSESPSADAMKEKAIVCTTCHGEGGNAIITTSPILAGQTSRYMYLQLKDFKEGRRKDPLMSAMVGSLSKDDMRALADYFAGQKKKRNNFNADPEKAAKGKAVADAALCTMCHLGGFAGQNEIPRVAGQHYDYVVKQLKDFRARNRTNDAGNMTSVSKGLSDEDIENLAHYISGLD